MLHFEIARPDERGLITNPLGLAADRLTTKRTGRGRCQSLMSRETNNAAPVRCNACFSGAFGLCLFPVFEPLDRTGDSFVAEYLGMSHQHGLIREILHSHFHESSIPNCFFATAFARHPDDYAEAR